MIRRIGFIIAAVMVMAVPGSPATLTFLAGDVVAGKEGSPGKAAINMTLNPGDIVKTGGKSLAIISMNNSIIRLLENTRVVVTKDDAETGEITYTIGRIFSKLINKDKSKLNINAITIVVAVRGTEFFMAYGRKMGDTRDIWLCVNKGKVEITGVATKKSIFVREGEGILIPGGKDFTDPKKYEWTKGLNWNMDPAKGDVFDKTDLDGMYNNLLKQDYD